MEKSMKKNQIKMAVAGAVLAAASASANAGIVIPAGDWTLDVSGNVNYYTSWTHGHGTNAVVGGLAGSPNRHTDNTMGNGLLPNFLGFTGTTRQNDLDVSFTISLQPGSANNAALQQVGSAGNTQGGLNNRQAFITFGDKSWGSVKMGKDLGIFASDAILNDLTLLGVGGGSAGSAGNTSLGRIGSGYIYADWKPQIAYTTPNMNGFQATVGISKAFNSSSSHLIRGTHSGGDAGAYTYSLTNRGSNANVDYEGKASYSFAAAGATGKVWVSGLAQHVGAMQTETKPIQGWGDDLTSQKYGVQKNNDPMAYAVDIGAQTSISGFDLVAYGYYGSGVGTTGQFLNNYGLKNHSWTDGAVARDSYGGYLQAAYTLPTKTKVALSWGESKLDLGDGEDKSYVGNTVRKNEQWNAMLIHPLTKHLNLVGEYSIMKSRNQNGDGNQANTGSVGAILFF